MTDATSLADFLKTVLDARRLTERALAEGAGISQSGISNMIHGKPREPDPRTLKALAQYLDVDVFILFRLLGYVPPFSEIYGAYDPMALYIARRYMNLPADKQRAFLHILETLLDDPAQKQDIQTVRESPALAGIEDALPEIINQAANWYLSAGQFASPAEIDPQPAEEVLPGMLFGQLSQAAQHRLLSLMRHKVRQVYAPYMVNEEDR